MPVGQLAALRNLKNGIVVFSVDPSNSRNYIQLEAAGDPSGGDVQYVSQEALVQPAVVKAIVHGVVKLEENTLSDEISQRFQAQVDAARAREEQARKAVEMSIQRTTNSDLIGFPCIAPSGNGTCGQHVPMKEELLAERPPLCAKDAHLAGQFVPTEDWDGQKKVIKWVRSTLGAREVMAQ